MPTIFKIQNWIAVFLLWGLVMVAWVVWIVAVTASCFAWFVARRFFVLMTEDALGRLGNTTAATGKGFAMDQQL